MPSPVSCFKATAPSGPCEIPVATAQGRTKPSPFSCSIPVSPQRVYKMYPVILWREQGSK